MPRWNAPGTQPPEAVGVKAMLVYFGNLLARAVIWTIAGAVALFFIFEFLRTSGIWTEPGSCWAPLAGGESWYRVNCPTTAPAFGAPLPEKPVPNFAPHAAPSYPRAVAPVWTLPSFAPVWTLPPVVYPSFAPWPS